VDALRVFVEHELEFQFHVGSKATRDLRRLSSAMNMDFKFMTKRQDGKGREDVPG
jgi:hypothetical protein